MHDLMDTNDASGDAGWIRHSHNGNANMLYVDEHVGVILKKMFKGKWTTVHRNGIGVIEYWRLDVHASAIRTGQSASSRR